MTDKDSQTLRGMLGVYGFDGVIYELLQVVRSYSQQSQRWYPVQSALQRVIWSYKRPKR